MRPPGDIPSSVTDASSNVTKLPPCFWRIGKKPFSYVRYAAGSRIVKAAIIVTCVSVIFPYLCFIRQKLISSAVGQGAAELRRAAFPLAEAPKAATVNPGRQNTSKVAWTDSSATALTAARAANRRAVQAQKGAERLVSVKLGECLCPTTRTGLGIPGRHSAFGRRKAPGE